MVLAATDDALAQPQPGAGDGATTASTRRTSIRRSEQFDTEDDPQFSGNDDDDGRPAQRLHEGRDAARPADPRLRRGRRRRVARGAPRQGQGQGRRLQGHVGPAEGVRRRARLQLAARRGEHRRPRDRAGAARLQAGRRDPVLRLHLAGVHAAPRRARDDALALEQRVRRRRSSSASTYGGYIRGAIYHSQTGASLFTHCPGLRVVCPATALDANGLLRTAIRCDDPVIFLEHKHLYRQTYNKAAYPGPELHDPVRQGEAWCARAPTSRSSPTARRCSARSPRRTRCAEERGISVEVIDLRSLSPWDQEAVYASGEEDEPRDRRATRTRSRGATAPRSRRASPTTASRGSTRR